MSIVTPIPQQTTIKAYKAPGWDNRLIDIRLFETSTERDSYLQARWIKTWNNCSVQHTGRSIRLEASINEMLECGYISWINNGLEGTARTFYAWVTSVDYVNVNTVEITFEVDWIQTYLFDYTFKGCFIERQHVNDDVYGKYVLPENLDTGEFICTQTDFYFPPTPGSGLVVQVLAPTYKVGGIGMVSGLESKGYLANVEGIADFQLLLNQYNTTPEKIVSIYMCTADMIGSNHNTVDVNQTIQITHTSQVDGYTPHNQKTLQYPFQFISIDNFNGESEIVRWEENNLQVSGQPYPPMQFKVRGSAVPKPYLEIYPLYYKKGAQKTFMDGTEESAYSQIKVTFEDFPSVPFATDSYRAWVSEFGRSFQVNENANIITGVVGFLGNLTSRNWGGAITGAVNAYNTQAQIEQEKESHKIHSTQLHGSVSSSGFNFSRGTVGFRITQYSAKGEFLKRVDDYFDQYGYRVDSVGVPNIRGRQYFNFVKCSYADVDCPNEDAKLMMEKAMMQGTFFWHVNNMTHTPGGNPII